MCEMLDIIEKRGEKRGILISLKNLMETMEVGIDRAMDILKIPSEERNLYGGFINGKTTK